MHSTTRTTRDETGSSAGAAAPAGSIWRRRVGYAVGVLLLVGAVVIVLRRHEALTGAMDALRRPSVPALGLLLGAVAANVVLTAVFLRLLISRYGRVGWVEMQALVAAATLVNFLPMRPGLFGRIAYHKAVNDIPVLSTVKTVGQGVAITMIVAGYLAAVVVVAGANQRGLWIGAVAPIPVLLGASLVPAARVWVLAALVRHLELFVWGARYHAAFVLIGSPIDPTAALALACASVVTTMVPFISNGLGLREWAIGLLAPLLTAYGLEIGVAAELVNRAAELIVIAGLGVAGMAWLGRRRTSTE